MSNPYVIDDGGAPPAGRTPPPAASPDPRRTWTGATRYLCCGAELDEEFATTVLDELFLQPKRAVAPSYGIDLVPIVKHCVKARRRRTIRDLALLAVVLVELVLFPVPTLIAVLAVALARDVASRAVGLAVGGALALASIWAFAGRPAPPNSGAQWRIYSTALWRILSWGPFGHFDLFLFSLAIAFLLTVAIRYGEWYYSYWLVGRQLRDETFDPDRTQVVLRPWMQRRLDEIAVQQYSNVTLYLHSEHTPPFVGSGALGRLWSFSINLKPRDDDAAARLRGFQPFTPVDLHNHVERWLRDLRRPEQGLAYGLPGFDSSYHLFAPGWMREGGTPPHLLYPDAQMPRADVERVILREPGSLRHYRCLRAEWQNGEMAVTAFLHLAMDGRSLFVEFTPCAVAPIKGWYKNVDVYKMPRLEEMWPEFLRSVRDALPTLFGSPQHLIHTYWIPRLKRFEYENNERRVRSRRLVIDYGAHLSVRERASMPEPKGALQLFDPEHHVMSPRRHGQLLDVEKYTKTIASQVLDAILEFLEERNLDTTEFRARRTQILDSQLFAAVMQGDVATWGQGPVPPK
jgi:hypothetical protein